MKKLALLLGVFTTLTFASDGAALLQKNCSSCHMLTTPTPDMIPTFKAPAMEAVGFHIKLAIKDKSKMKNFIVDYVLNPDASKSVCESNRVSHFGVMPSMKGKVSKKDLETIADYIIAQYPTKAFKDMIHEIQRNDKLHALMKSPFLINKNGLPHLTKLLIQNWDKAALGLNKEQKEKLLKVRQTTLLGVKKLKKEISALEAEIIEAMADNEDPQTVHATVDQVAKLKAEATKIHLQCISDTIRTLNDEQITYLLPFWGI
jgi:cytochrome c553